MWSWKCHCKGKEDATGVISRPMPTTEIENNQPSYTLKYPAGMQLKGPLAGVRCG
jgi:hypothetical protein